MDRNRLSGKRGDEVNAILFHTDNQDFMMIFGSACLRYIQPLAGDNFKSIRRVFLSSGRMSFFRHSRVNALAYLFAFEPGYRS